MDRWCNDGGLVSVDGIVPEKAHHLFGNFLGRHPLLFFPDAKQAEVARPRPELVHLAEDAKHGELVVGEAHSALVSDRTNARKGRYALVF